MKGSITSRVAIGGHGQIGVALSALALSLAAPHVALAQTEKPEAPDSPAQDDIVVTGTLVRGIAPPGANVISTAEADIKATGASTTVQLLQTIPQLGSFNNLQSPAGGSGNQVTTNRPNLRTLPGFNTAGGSTTLVLMDGHRLVGMGVTSTSPDPDVIPPAVIQRLEIVPDGGSAVYGSDAVAGVMNFITLKRYEGIKVDASYGFADDYHQLNASVLAGTDWGSGSAYVSYNYAEHSALFGRDRDFAREYPAETGQTAGLTNLQCRPGNVLITNGGVSTYYALPYSPATAVPNTYNQCDISDNASFYPREHRHSALVGVTQQLSDAITFDVKGFFTQRVMDLTTGPYRVAQAQPVRVGAGGLASPYFAAYRIGAETSHQVYFQFGENDAAGQQYRLTTWGITPTITVNLGGGWQARLLGSYSRSDIESHLRNYNLAGLNNAITAGLINPYNPYDPATNSAAALATITNSEGFARTRQKLFDLRGVIDGELFQLPGGGVKLAAGAEYYEESFNIVTGDQVVPGSAMTGSAAQSVGGVTLVPAIAALTPISLKRNVKSVFAEMVVPIFGAENSVPLLRELTISAAGRYDSYSDVGDTFNPKIGLTWRPVEWLKLRGSWGKSFNAPSLADAPGTVVSNAISSTRLPSAAQIATGIPAIQPGQTSRISVQGNLPGIRPQTAQTLSFGFDAQPPFIPGLNLSVTYYKINLQGVIGLPPTDAENTFGPYRDLVTFAANQPGGAFTQAQIDDVYASVALDRGRCSPSPQCVYAIVDLRKRNLGDFKLDGLDFNASYKIPTGFGAINLAFNASKELNRQRQALPGQPFYDEINVSNFRARMSAGVEIGNFLAQATLNHTAGYDLALPVGFAGTQPGTGEVFTKQTTVSSFNVVDLFFKYDFEGGGLGRSLQLTLNINNVFDQSPPEYRGGVIGGQLGYINGLTLGRLVQFGISKAF